MIYLITILVLLIGVIRFEILKRIDKNNLWFWFEWLFLVLLAGFRYKVGGDTQFYYDDFDNYPTLLDINEQFIKNSRFNILWIYLVSTCKTIVNDFAFFQIIHAIIVNTTFFLFFKKYTNRYFTAILIFNLLYFFKYNTEILRASLAVSTFLWSFKYLLCKKWIKYYALSFIALGFHSEALIIFVFPFFYKLEDFKINIKNFSFILLLSFVLLFSVNLLPVMNNIANLLGNENVIDSVSLYTDSSKLGQGVTVLGYLRKIVVNSVWLLIAYLLNGNKYYYIRIFLIPYFVFSILILNYSNIFYRFIDFLNPIAIIALCLGYEETLKRKALFLRIVIIAYIIYMILSYVIYLLDGYWVLFYPYSSIFNQIEYPMRASYFFDIF